MQDKVKTRDPSKNATNDNIIRTFWTIHNQRDAYFCWCFFFFFLYLICAITNLVRIFRVVLCLMSHRCNNKLTRIYTMFVNVPQRNGLRVFEHFTDHTPYIQNANSIIKNTFLPVQNVVAFFYLFLLSCSLLVFICVQSNTQKHNKNLRRRRKKMHFDKRTKERRTTTKRT